MNKSIVALAFIAGISTAQGGEVPAVSSTTQARVEKLVPAECCIPVAGGRQGWGMMALFQQFERERKIKSGELQCPGGKLQNPIR